MDNIWVPLHNDWAVVDERFLNRREDILMIEEMIIMHIYRKSKIVDPDEPITEQG